MDPPTEESISWKCTFVKKNRIFAKVVQNYARVLENTTNQEEAVFKAKTRWSEKYHNRSRTVDDKLDLGIVQLRYKKPFKLLTTRGFVNILHLNQQMFNRLRKSTLQDIQSIVDKNAGPGSLHYIYKKTRNFEDEELKTKFVEELEKEEARQSLERSGSLQPESLGPSSQAGTSASPQIGAPGSSLIEGKNRV